MEVYVVQPEEKEITLMDISEEDPIAGRVQTFLVREPRKFLFWTRERVYSIRVLVSDLSSWVLQEQELFTARLARQLATTASPTGGTLNFLLGFGAGFLATFLAGKFL